MPCSTCIGKRVALSFAPLHTPGMSNSLLAKLRDREEQALIRTYGSDVTFTQWDHGEGVTKVVGRLPPRVCSVCDHVFCPRLVPAETAAPKGDPRDLFGLLSPQDLGDDDE
jgi:hypothetical protein